MLFFQLNLKTFNNTNDLINQNKNYVYELYYLCDHLIDYKVEVIVLFLLSSVSSVVFLYFHSYVFIIKSLHCVCEHFFLR